MATGRIGEAHVSLRATLDQYERDLNRARAATQRAAGQMAKDLGRVEIATKNINEAANRTSLGIQRLSRQFLVLRAAAGAALSVVGVRAAAQAADAWVLLGGRLKLLTGSTEAAAAAQEELFQVAQRSRTPLEAVAMTYVRMRAVTDELGLSQADALRVTESLSKLLIISGVNAQESAAALHQLTQTFQRGVVRGDELKSLFENFPAVLRIMADDVGMADRAFAKMAIESGVSVDKLINAVGRAGERIDQDFAALPVTIGQGITLITNSLQRAIGITSTADGSYDSLVQTLIRLNEVVSSPEFATGLSTIFQGIALVLKDLANGIERIGHAVNILKLIADQDFGRLWEQYLSKGKEAEEETKKIGKAFKGIAEAGTDEATTKLMDSLGEAAKNAKTELALVEFQLNNFTGAMRLLEGTSLEQETIVPEAVIGALEALAAAGYDVTNGFASMPPAIQATFLELVKLGDRTADVTAQLESQQDALKQLKDAHLEYQQSRVQGEGIDAQIERDEEAYERWKEIQDKKEQDEKAYQERIAAGSRLPDEIDTANVAAQGLAHTLTDFENMNFDSVIEGIADIGRQLVEAVIQAMIFRAIMASMGGSGGGLAPIFGGAGDVTRMARGGFITSRPMIMPMATGGALIGEAGPEAVLPLKRMASGNLGVASEGGSGGSSNVINIDARQSTPGTAAAAVNAAIRMAPGAVVNAQARGQMGRGKHPF